MEPREERLVVDHAAKVTGQSLRALIQGKRVISGSIRHPTSDAYEELATAIRGLQWTVRLSTGTWRAARQRNKRINNALEVLEQDVPALLSELEEMASIDAVRNRIALLKQLQANVAELRRRVSYKVTIARRQEVVEVVKGHWLQEDAEDRWAFEKWHHYVFDLIVAFRKAISSTNPKLILQVSNTGPITKFVAAVAPDISNETPEPSTIARYVARQGKRTR